MTWLPSTEDKRFIRNYGDALTSRNAALFVGAGVSRAAGYVDWKSLLRRIADDLELDVDRESDLIALTQFHVNKFNTRSAINQTLIDELTRGATLTPIHGILARLPTETIWTTNYDQLIERSFEAAGKRLDVKRSTASLAQILRGRDAVLYKMHGCVIEPDKAVLTKDDYERYQVSRALFSDSLKGDLIEKTFLFLGFSFTDPNIEQILARVRTLLGKNQKDHFCVMRRERRPPALEGKAKADFEYQERKAQLQSADLLRFGIQTLWIDEYEHLEPLLKALAAYVDRSNVFVSGSFEDPMPLGAQRLESLSRKIGQRLIGEGFRLVSGFGRGIGEYVILGALLGLYLRSEARDDDRLLLRPFPRAKDPIQQDAQNLQHRRDLISRVGTLIVLTGNRGDGQGAIRSSVGTLEEVNLALQMGKFVVPVGVTGHVAGDLWKQAMAEPNKFLPGLKAEAELQILGDPLASEEVLLDALFAILAAAKRAAELRST